jgi:hypothetical protein
MSTVIAKNVQVGTSGTPAQNFTVYQPASPDGTVRVGNGNSGSVTDLLTLNSSGNLGLGVAPSAWSASFRAMQVGSRSALYQDSGSATLLANNIYNDGTNRYIASAASSIYLQGSGAHQWYTAPSGTAGNAITFTQRAALDGSGFILDPDGVGSTYLRLNTPSGGDGHILLQRGGSNRWQISSGTGNALQFYNYTAGSESARIDSGGALLVGRTSRVGGNAAASYIQTLATSGSTAGYNVQLTNTSTASVFECYNSGSNYIGGITCSNTATSFPTSSDIRLKKDVADAGSASAKVEQIRIVSHGWKSDDSTVEFGVIAQELVSVAPQAVMVGDDGDEIKITWGVDYSKLVPMLIKAIQELKAEFDAYKASHP